MIAHILIMEVKEDFDAAMMQLVAYYARLVASQWDTPAVQETCFPSLGLEVCGNCFRCVVRTILA